MDFPSLEEVIRQHIALPPRPNGRGFFSLLCKVCNDHGRKGKRAGFNFEGGAVGYHCFNCGHDARYSPATHEKMPYAMVTVLDAYGIPKTDWEPVLFNALAMEQTGGEAVKSTFKSIEPIEITFPPFFYPLTDDKDDDWAQATIEYLSGRGVDWKSHPFFLVKKHAEHPDNPKWYGRFIIPIYKDKKLVFWQGRDLTDLHTQKYLSCNGDKSVIISDYQQIRRYTDEPLYITEGWFDAYHLQGEAVFGNRLMEAQIKWLNQSPRQKVVIPDRFGDGHLLARDALQLGWSVSMPDIGSCKDVNEAVIKYGELYVRQTIRENTSTGFDAEVRLGVYCEPSQVKKTNKRPSRQERT